MPFQLSTGIRYDPMESASSSSGDLQPHSIRHGLEQYVTSQRECGDRDVDEFIKTLGIEIEVLELMKQIPIAKRSQFYSALSARSIAHPSKYLRGCASNYWSDVKSGKIQTPSATSYRIHPYGKGAHPGGKGAPTTPPPSLLQRTESMHGGMSPSERSLAGSPLMASSVSPWKATSATAMPTQLSSSQGSGSRADMTLKADGNTAVPEWIHKMFAQQGRPSELLNIFVSQLSSPSVSMMMEIMPEPKHKLYLAFASMLNPSSWSNPNEFVVRSMRAWQALTAPPVHGAISQTVVQIPVRLLVIGGGIGTYMMAARTAVNFVNKKQLQFHVNIKSTHSFEINPLANEVLSHVSQETGWPMCQEGDAALLPSFIQRSLNEWHGDKIMILVCIPSPKGIDGANLTLDRVEHQTLHEHGTKMIWPVLEAMKLMTENDRTRALLIGVFPTVNTPSDDQVL